MPLLVDYSKRRAKISSKAEDSIRSLSFHVNDAEDDKSGDESFACCCDYEEPAPRKKLDDSSSTVSTADSTSEHSYDDFPEVHRESQVSFRIKRSSMGFGSTSNHTDDLNNVSQRDRFFDSMQDLKAKQPPEPPKRKTITKPKTLGYRRQASAPARVNSGDSLHVRLQYAAWKKRQQRHLSASAEIATISDRNLFLERKSSAAAPFGRRATMSHLTEEAASSRKHDLMGSSSFEQLPQSQSAHHQLETTPQQQPKEVSTARRRRRVTMSHVSSPSEQQPARQDKPARRRHSNSNHVREPSQDHTRRQSQSARRLVQEDIPGPPSMERRRTSEMDALKALAGKRSSSFRSSTRGQERASSFRGASRGQDSAPKIPNSRYSRRRHMSMSHVNSPPQPPPRTHSKVEAMRSNSMQNIHQNRRPTLISGKPSQSFNYPSPAYTRQGTFPAARRIGNDSRLASLMDSMDGSDRYSSMRSSMTNDSKRRSTLLNSRNCSSNKLMDDGSKGGRHSSKRRLSNSKLMGDESGATHRHSNTTSRNESGRSLTRNGSGRRLGRSGSGRKLLGRTPSGRALTRSGSSRNLARTASARNLARTNSARNLAGRKMRRSPSGSRLLEDGSDRPSRRGSMGSGKKSPGRRGMVLSSSQGSLGGSFGRRGSNTSACTTRMGNSSCNNLSGFVTGSRIRRHDSYQHNVLGYR